MEEILDFMRRLAAHNDRDWFDAHRAEWLHVKQLRDRLAGELIEGIASFDASVRGLRPQDCTYRIARDTRFSKDKSPYKTWLGIFIAPRGKQAGYAGYYLHLEPTAELAQQRYSLTSGIYCPEPPVLRSVRDEIFDNGAVFVDALDKARGFELYRGNMLKRTPTGFPSGSAYDEYLRLKDLYVVKPLTEQWLLDAELVPRIVAEFRRTEPLIALLNRAVQFAYDEMM